MVRSMCCHLFFGYAPFVQVVEAVHVVVGLLSGCTRCFRSVHEIFGFRLFQLLLQIVPRCFRWCQIVGTVFKICGVSLG